MIIDLLSTTLIFTLFTSTNSMTTVFLKGASSSVFQTPSSPSSLSLLSKWTKYACNIVRTSKPPITLCWDGDPVEGTAYSLMLPELLDEITKLKDQGEGLRLVQEVKAFRLSGGVKEISDNLNSVYSSRGLNLPPVDVEIVETDVEDTWPDPNPYIELGWRSLNSVKEGEERVIVCLGGGPTVLSEYTRAKNSLIPSTWHCLDLPNGRRCSVNVSMEEGSTTRINEKEWEGGGCTYTIK
mmetsp:Transcript_9874/g.20041  ORF Transcript_9874/g.20041 Transcript_9874/m.20041 type:complete len:239 (+) Transcript_9874:63-779(+)